MFRWLFICVLLAGGTFGAFYALVTYVPEIRGYVQSATRTPTPPPKGDRGRIGAPEQPRGNDNDKDNNDKPVVRPDSADAGSVPPVGVTLVGAAQGGLQALIIPDARVLSTERQEVPSERDGKLLFLATELK